MGSVETKKKQRTLRGYVTSAKMDKTRVVTVERLVKHPVAGKTIKRSTKVMIHDEENRCQLGDEVLIVPTRPRSARKSFMLLSVLKQAAEPTA